MVLIFPPGTIGQHAAFAGVDELQGVVFINQFANIVGGFGRGPKNLLGKFSSCGIVGINYIVCRAFVYLLRQVKVVIGDGGYAFVLVLGHVAVGIVKVIIGAGIAIDEAYGDISCVVDSDERMTLRFLVS